MHDDDTRSSKYFTHRIDDIGGAASSSAALAGGGSSSRTSAMPPTVISRREVQACKLLGINLLQRKKKGLIERKFADAVEELNATSSSSAASDAGADPAGSGRIGSNLSPRSQHRDSALGGGTRTTRNMASFAGCDVAQLTGPARKEYLQTLQRARRILLEAADDTVQKDIFGDVPQEWLNMIGGLARAVLFTSLLTIIPIAGVMLECSTIECGINNKTDAMMNNNSNSNITTEPTSSTTTTYTTTTTTTTIFTATTSENATTMSTTTTTTTTMPPATRAPPKSKARDTYLYVSSMRDCPFESWSHAMFGIWIAVGMSFLFGCVVAVWSVLDKCCRPLYDHFRSETLKGIAATLSSVPFRTRFLVVCPPLIGLAVSGVLVYTRLNTDPSRVTWSWGLIVGPAISGLGLALFLKGVVTWRFLQSGNAAATAAMTGNAIPSYWAIRLFVLDAIALFVAATVTPAIGARMADCPNYPTNFVDWPGVFAPFFCYLGLNTFTSLVEWFYRLANRGDSESQHLDLVSGNRPLWQDALSLILRQGGLFASASLAYLKLSTSDYNDVLWIQALGGFLAYLCVGFILAWAEFFAMLREAKAQYMRLDKIVTPIQIEESLVDYGGAQHAVAV